MTSGTYRDARRPCLASLTKHRRRGADLTGVLRSGKPWEKLDNVAVEVGASLIVVGRRGAGRGRSVGLGTVTDHLLRSASRPVLTVSNDFDAPDTAGDGKATPTEAKKDHRKHLASFASNSRVVGSALILAALLLPGTAAAAVEPIVDDGAKATPRDAASKDDDGSRWSINFTPVLLFPQDEYRWGGGVDPELNYTYDLGSVHLSAGGRWGAYYAKNLFGTVAMPTLRLMVPIGSVEPYVSVGAGYGWLRSSNTRTSR